MQVILYANGSIEFKYKNLQNAGITQSNSTRFITGIFADNLYYTFNVLTNSFDRKTSSLDISGSYFTASDINKITNYTYNKIVESDFSNYNFISLDLSSIDLSGCDLSGADLSGTILNNATLQNTNLSNAIISNTSFLFS